MFSFPPPPPPPSRQCGKIHFLTTGLHALGAHNLAAAVIFQHFCARNYTDVTGIISQLLMSALLTLYGEAYVRLFNTQEHAAAAAAAHTPKGKRRFLTNDHSRSQSPPAHILYRKSHLIPIHYVNYPLFTNYLQAHWVALGKVNVSSQLRPRTFPLRQLMRALVYRMPDRTVTSRSLYNSMHVGGLK